MEESSKGFKLPGWATLTLRIIIVGALPLVLVLINARVLMTDVFMKWEYNRPDFEPDPFGFTTQDRLTYGPLALDYLFNDQGIDFLAKLKQHDGTPLYNPRELSHMNDVKGVTQMLARFGVTLVVVYAIALALLAFSQAARPALLRSLVWGGIVTIAVILLGLFLTITSFDWLFTEFHRLFFTGDSWLFPVTDTLIRLFPEPFWIDAFALMFGGALLEAALIGVLSMVAVRRGSGMTVES